jgi:hypothetical protein
MPVLAGIPECKACAKMLRLLRLVRVILPLLRFQTSEEAKCAPSKLDNPGNTLKTMALNAKRNRLLAHGVVGD